MKAFKLILAGGAAVAALATATPASAQYYPGQGGGNVIGQVLGQILGGNVGYGSRGGYGAYGGSYGGYGGSQMAVNQCASAVSQRLGGGYGGYGYGRARVQISSVEPRSSGKMRVRGIAQTNAGGYGQNVTFKCNVDYRGRISDLDFDRMSNRNRAYGYNQGYGNYRRY